MTTIKLDKYELNQIIVALGDSIEYNNKKGYGFLAIEINKIRERLREIRDKNKPIVQTTK